jgi:hypothetical protein
MMAHMKDGFKNYHAIFPCQRRVVPARFPSPAAGWSWSRSERIGQASLRDANASSLDSFFRGLKPTATITGSLRDFPTSDLFLLAIKKTGVNETSTPV